MNTGKNASGKGGKKTTAAKKLPEPPKESKGQTCGLCRKPLDPGDRRGIVRIGIAGDVHGQCHVDNQAKIDQIFAQAEREGRHGPPDPDREIENTFQRANRLASGCDFSEKLRLASLAAQTEPEKSQ